MPNLIDLCEPCRQFFTREKLIYSVDQFEKIDGILQSDLPRECTCCSDSHCNARVYDCPLCGFLSDELERFAF